MRTYNMTAVIWKEANAYVSKCPETGVASCGDTPEEALRNLKEAVELYLENAKHLGMLREIHETLAAPGKFTTSFAASVRRAGCRASRPPRSSERSERVGSPTHPSEARAVT